MDVRPKPEYAYLKFFTKRALGEVAESAETATFEVCIGKESLPVHFWC